MVLATAAMLAVAMAASGAAATEFSGKAAFYSHSGPTADGGIFDPEGFTAAHRTLAFGTRLRVTDRATGRSVIVTVTDRGPFGRKERVLDMSLGAARALGMLARGVIDVDAEIL
jgi:rare lipoprotein A